MTTVGDRPERTSLGRLATLLAAGEVMVLSGAGLSTESGIPDYRGPSGALRRSLPMTYQTFTRDPSARRRYWARSQLGWRVVARAAPNDGHRAVATLQSWGRLTEVVTQNVDGLHQAGGATSVVELHGNLERVACLTCLVRTTRDELDLRLRAANAGWTAESTGVNPDGDVALDDTHLQDFEVLDCLDCGGLLKPDVVFFGENVPIPRVERCYAAVDELTGPGGALLVAGSSLTVMSGLRFVRRAAKSGTPVVIANRGGTRGDPLASYRLEVGCSEFLTALADRRAA